MALTPHIKAKRPQFFDEDGVDDVLSALTNMLAEHWVLRERLYVVEQLAAERGLFSSKDIESYQLSEAQQAELATARQALLEDVFINIRRPAE